VIPVTTNQALVSSILPQVIGPTSEAGSIRAVDDEVSASRGVYSIGAVARMLEIPAATIRNWEGRYATIVPERSSGGHRLYSRDQVEQLRFIATQVARGLSAADAHRLLSEQRQDGQPLMNDASGVPTRLLVLLAERDPVAAELEHFFLRTEGYEVDLAFAVDEAEERWLESHPQLAIVDLMISGGLGMELCRRLKRHESGAVLAISVLEVRDEALAAGADAFLQKPFDPLELVSTVKDLLGASALIGRRAQRAR
jgi:CheY-like chemotaxis protein